MNELFCNIAISPLLYLTVILAVIQSLLEFAKKIPGIVSY